MEGASSTIWRTRTRTPRDDDRATIAARNAEVLSRRHFLLHDRRPGHIAAINPADLDPFLRSLLFTDGTVTRALEVKTLAPVSVTVISQTESMARGDVADHLEAPDETNIVRRRVAIGQAGSAPPVIWAESQIVPSRLPKGFLGVLEGGREGIGDALQRTALESRRDMLWFGLDAPPAWSSVASRAPAPVITRLYRAIAGGQPALLISESFAVEDRNGTYCLKWPL